jgi:hypothetical protein
LLTADFRRAGQHPAGELVEQFQLELRRLAAATMRRERADHTLQTTALVNELYLELVKVRGVTSVVVNEQDKAAFLGFAGHRLIGNPSRIVPIQRQHRAGLQGWPRSHPDLRRGPSASCT